MSSKLDKIFNNSEVLKIDDKSKLVIMSDCHRGAGDVYDNFFKNQNIVNAALRYYYNRGFTYLELGDGDDMWEVRDYNDIIDAHLDTFKLLKKFNDKNRLIMVHGNHDIAKKSVKVLEKSFFYYFDRVQNQKVPLLKDLKVYESLILSYKGCDIFLLHGHQVDFLNSNLWRLSRFLVRYVWRSLEFIGIKEPTKVSKNYQMTGYIDKKLNDWSQRNNTILIAGHTHRSVFPQKGQNLYFNDGSCIQNDGITCLEIVAGQICLVKWEIKVGKNNVLLIKKRELTSKESIEEFYVNKV